MGMYKSAALKRIIDLEGRENILEVLSKDIRLVPKLLGNKKERMLISAFWFRYNSILKKLIDSLTPYKLKRRV
jgi:hypothetical protein